MTVNNLDNGRLKKNCQNTAVFWQFCNEANQKLITLILF